MKYFNAGIKTFVTGIYAGSNAKNTEMGSRLGFNKNKSSYLKKLFEI